jgi:hypothetical protein
MISTLENPIIGFRLVIASDDGTSQEDGNPYLTPTLDHEIVRYRPRIDPFR